VNKLKRKTIKVDELPKGFFYFTDTHIVEGVGQFIYTDHLPEGITIGMKDKTVIVGTKKAPAATGTGSDLR
jgi:hypothetical protein